MEYMTSSLDFVRKIQAEIRNGKAISVILPELIMEKEDPFHKRMRVWWFQEQNGGARELSFPTYYQKALVTLLRMSLNGAPVLDALAELEEEMSEELHRQITAHLESLPFKLLIPLMLFFFPAFVVLLFGPLLNHFLYEVGL